MSPSLSPAAGRVRVVGVRHHSPACARLVAEAIARERPQAVLIEGPADFNPRLPELLLDHALPVALYSYANTEEQSARCWFPFLDYSPEWVALRQGHAAGAALRFIDLPHWHYRTLPDGPATAAGLPRGRLRHGEAAARLCRRFGCEGDDALWDHLFESAAGDELSRRLDVYFAELRGDDPGTGEDQAREHHMAQWLAWAAARFERVLVVCGGWHKPPLERALQMLQPDPDAPAVEPEVPLPGGGHAAGSYLVPFEYRQVDALGGYGAGMPSPMYYQWVWQHGLHGAGERATRSMVARLRQAQVALSTADLLAHERTAAALAALRGHAEPLRADLLDALQSAVVKEALDSPAPWAGARRLQAHHHPVLREALLALTGDGIGRLHGETPLPPLVHDVRRRLDEAGIAFGGTPQPLALDRRQPADAPRAHLLWQLHALGIGGVELVETRAPRAARGLAPELRFEEHWHLQQTERWHADLIEAAAHGATLAAAARQALLQRIAQAPGSLPVLTECLLHAVRAGLQDMGRDVAQQMAQGIGRCHAHGELARAAQSLAGIVLAGFWGDDPRELLEGPLALMADRLLWLLEDRDGAGSPETIEDDVQAAAVFDTLLRLSLPGLEPDFVRAALVRLAQAPSRPPALRGAALGVAYRHGALDGADADAARAAVMAVTRTMPPRDALGDFLYGLFSCARALATEDDGIVRAIHAAIAAIGVEDFLVALPALRGALGWFPPRERAALAAHVARLVGLDPEQQHRLLRLREGGAALIDARRVEARALAWAREIGLNP